MIKIMKRWKHQDFRSETGKTSNKLNKIDYYPVIHLSITKYTNVQECHSFMCNTFDLDICMNAYPLIRKSPGRYRNQIILAGTFHLIWAYYMNMIGKKMAGSGLVDVLLEAGLISGSQ